MVDLEKEVRGVIGSSACQGVDAPILLNYTPGESKLLIITGDNASGKSLVGRLFSLRAQKEHKIESIRVSMELRTMEGIHRAFVFGDEAWQSTGMISLDSVSGGIKACQSRDKSHIIIFDEPDIGLSEGYQAAMGKMLEKFASNMPILTEFMIIITHSRFLVKQMVGCKPHFLRVGDNVSMSEFLQVAEEKTLEDLELLQKRALITFQKVSALMERRRKGM